jgi:hypothetical protein
LKKYFEIKIIFLNQSKIKENIYNDRIKKSNDTNDNKPLSCKRLCENTIALSFLLKFRLNVGLNKIDFTF